MIYGHALRIYLPTSTELGKIPEKQFIMSVPPKPPEILCYCRRVIDDKKPSTWMDVSRLGWRARDAELIVSLYLPCLEVSE